MLDQIGALVAQVRARRGLSVADLAATIEGDVAAVEKLEAGQSGVTTTQLDAIAETLGLDPRALRRAEEIARPAPSVFLRHQGMQDFRDADLDVLDRAIEHARTMNALGKLLGEPESPWTNAGFAKSAAPHDTSDAPAKHGYRLATELRRTLQLPFQPLHDLRLLAEESLGIAVVVRRLSTRGVCAVKAGGAAAIVLGSASIGGAAKLRSDIAHELCHLLHDPDRDGVHVVLDREHDRSTHANEQRARAYAVELLLPRAGLNKLLGLPATVEGQQQATGLVAAAMDHFGTSWQMTANHLCNHGFVDKALRIWLEALDARRPPLAWATTLPAIDGPSLLVVERAQRAHEQTLITDSEARSALGLETLDPLPWDEPR